LPESIQIQLKKGVLEMCVLTLLARGDSYGYELFSKLMAQIGMGEGTIYPLMRRMQNEGLVATYLTESTGGAPRKYYKITEQGRGTLVAQRAEWKDFRSAVDAILGDEA
jgi:PadR family transcriptional regulator PadR